ncbi:hypothetical protein QNM99_18975 [Pseudomonas sp. PCH446]
MDSSKFDQRLTYRVALLDKALTVISDEQLPASWWARLREQGCTTLQASSQGLPIRKRRHEQLRAGPGQRRLENPGGGR